MNDNIFVDTNILLYARDASETEKQKIAAEKLDRLWDQQNGRLSTQVLNEYFVKVTRKLKPGLSPEEAWDDVEALNAWDPLPSTCPSSNADTPSNNATNSPGGIPSSSPLPKPPTAPRS